MEIWGQRLMIENCIVMYFLGGGGNFSLSTSFVGCSTVYGDVVQRLMIENITIIYFSGRGGNFSLFNHWGHSDTCLNLASWEFLVCLK
jgi:uncharacterized membrane protein